MKTKTLILGATGGIGYAVVKAHLEKEIPATILVRDVRKAYTLFGHHPLLEVVEGDALDSALLNRLAEGKTHILHGLNASFHTFIALGVQTNVKNSSLLFSKKKTKCRIG